MPDVVSAHTRDDITSGVDEPLMSADDVISEIESMMEVGLSSPNGLN